MFNMTEFWPGLLMATVVFTLFILSRFYPLVSGEKLKIRMINAIATIFCGCIAFTCLLYCGFSIFWNQCFGYENKNQQNESSASKINRKRNTSYMHMTIRNPYLFFSTQGQIKCQEFDLSKRFMEDKIETERKIC